MTLWENVILGSLCKLLYDFYKSNTNLITEISECKKTQLTCAGQAMENIKIKIQNFYTKLRAFRYAPMRLKTVNLKRQVHHLYK